MVDILSGVKFEFAASKLIGKKGEEDCVSLTAVSTTDHKEQKVALYTLDVYDSLGHCFLPYVFYIIYFC